MDGTAQLGPVLAGQAHRWQMSVLDCGLEGAAGGLDPGVEVQALGAVGMLSWERDFGEFSASLGVPEGGF